MEVEEKEHTLWEEERGKEPPRERMVNHLARCMPVEVEPEDTIISRTDPCLGRPAALVAAGKAETEPRRSILCWQVEKMGPPIRAAVVADLATIILMAARSL